MLKWPFPRSPNLRRTSKPCDAEKNLRWAIESLVEWQVMLEERNEAQKEAPLPRLRDNGDAGDRKKEEEDKEEEDEEDEVDEEEVEEDVRPGQDIEGKEPEAEGLMKEAKEKQENKEEEGKEAAGGWLEATAIIDIKANTWGVPVDKYLLHTVRSAERSSIGPPKLVYVNNLLEKMVVSAVRSVKLRAKEKLLKSQIQAEKYPPKKRFARLLACVRSEDAADDSLKIVKREQEMARAHEGVRESLAHFDVARATYKWLRRDYTLVTNLLELQDQQQNASTQLRGLEGEEKEKMETELSDIKTKQAKGLDLLIDNDRDSVLLGLYFLDANMSGSIEPDDLPCLTAQQFIALDLDRSHAITPSELSRAIKTTLIANKNEQTQKVALEAEISREHTQLDVLQKQLTKLTGPKQATARAHVRLDEEKLVTEIARRETELLSVKKRIHTHAQLIATVDQHFYASFMNNVWTHLQDKGNGLLDDDLQTLLVRMKEDEKTDPLMDIVMGPGMVYKDAHESPSVAEIAPPSAKVYPSMTEVSV